MPSLINRTQTVLLLICLVATSVRNSVAQSNVAEADSLKGPKDWHFRFDLFQMTLEQSGLHVSTNLYEILQNHPAESVIVVMGPANQNLVNGLVRFAQRGGAFMIATDQGIGGTPLASLAKGPVRAVRVDHQYNEFDDCLVLPPVQNGNPLIDRVSSLVFNKTGWIQWLDSRLGDWKSAALVPRLARPSGSASRQLVASVDLEQSGGRIVLAADHSLFTNGMLWHGDNAIFAINVAKFLSEGPRTRLVFLASEQPIGSYQDELAKQFADMPVPEIDPDQLPELELEQLLSVADAVIAKAEDSNLLNELVVNRPRSIRRPYYHRGLLFGLVACLLLLAAYQLGGKTQKQRLPLAARKMYSIFDLRNIAASDSVKASQRGQAAKLLAEQCMAMRIGSEDPAQWERAEVESADISKSEDREKLKMVRRVATEAPKPMTAKRLLEISGVLKELSN